MARMKSEGLPRTGNSRRLPRRVPRGSLLGCLSAYCSSTRACSWCALGTKCSARSSAWNEVFREVEIVEASAGDYFDQPADAMVSPANSFGIMDGGLDLAIRDQLGLE